MNVGEYIKALRLKAGYSQEQLGNLLGVQRAAVQKWECGRVQNLKRETIKNLSELFNVSPSSFIDSECTDKINLPPPNITRNYTTFPVIGEVAAGYDSVALEDWEGETVDIPDEYLSGRNREDFFILRVKGDSMYPDYKDGDKVLILKQTTLNYSGQVGVILYDGDYASLKKVEYRNGEDWLKMVPINPMHPTKKIEGTELENCRILGIPRLLIRNIED